MLLADNIVNADRSIMALLNDVLLYMLMDCVLVEDFVNVDRLWETAT